MKFDKWDLVIYLCVFVLSSYFFGIECHNLEQNAMRNGFSLGLNYYIFQSISCFSFMFSTLIFLKIYQLGIKQTKILK